MILIIAGVAVAAIGPVERHFTYRRQMQMLAEMSLDATPLPAPDPAIDAVFTLLDAID